MFGSPNLERRGCCWDAPSMVMSQSRRGRQQCGEKGRVPWNGRTPRRRLGKRWGSSSIHKLSLAPTRVGCSGVTKSLRGAARGKLPLRYKAALQEDPPRVIPPRRAHWPFLAVCPDATHLKTHTQNPAYGDEPQDSPHPVNTQTATRRTL